MPRSDPQPNSRQGEDLERNASIFQNQSQELVRFANGLVGYTDAQDVVSEAFLKAMTAPQWDAISNHRAYLYRVVRNEALSYHRLVVRRRAREQRAFGQWVIESPEPQPEVLAAVALLSDRQQAVVLLTFWEDLDESAVAGRLGISRGSVRQHRGRALAKLRRLLADPPMNE